MLVHGDLWRLDEVSSEPFLKQTMKVHRKRGQNNSTCLIQWWKDNREVDSGDKKCRKMKAEMILNMLQGTR